MGEISEMPTQYEHGVFFYTGTSADGLVLRGVDGLWGWMSHGTCGCLFCCYIALGRNTLFPSMCSLFLCMNLGLFTCAPATVHL